MNIFTRLIMLWVGAFVALIGTPLEIRSEEKVLKVGIIASLSGPQSNIGKDLRDGALLAIQEINDQWKNKGVKITLTVTDDGAVPENAEEAVQRLIAEGADLIFGVADSDCALAAAPIVTRAEIPMMTLATHAGLTKPHQKWVFRGNMSDADQSLILTDYLWDRFHGQERKIALLYEDTEYGRAGASAQKARLEQYRVSPVTEVSYSRGKPDMSDAVQEIKAAGASGVLIYGRASDAAPILAAIRETGLDATIMASSGWDSRSLSDLSPELTQGIIVAGYLAFASADREEIFGPSWREFAQSYRQRFGRDPGVMAAHAYSGMMCVARAYERKDFQTKKLTEGLEKTKAFETLLETLINFHDEDHDGVKFIHFTEFRGGQALVWKRNKIVKEQRFQARARPITIGEYQGRMYDSPVGTTMWMALHYALGRPSFIKDFHIMDEYGLKSTSVGTLFKGKVKAQVYKLVFRSEEDAIGSLNLTPFEDGEVPTQVAENTDEMTNYRDKHGGIYTDGTYWAGFKRVGNVVVLSSGDIPREDLQVIIDAILQDGFQAESSGHGFGYRIEKSS